MPPLRKGRRLLLRRVLRAELGERVSPAEVEDLVQSVRGAPEREIPALVRSRGSWAARWSRGRRELPEEMRRAIGDYRRLAAELVRTAPAARSAARRLKDLRRRATVLQPSVARRELREGLLRVAGRVAGVGLRSLLAQAVPGVGAALRVVGVVRKLGREMERDGGRGR